MTMDSSTFAKLWYVLTGPQRRAAIVLLGLMLIGMVLETLGIGLVIPALSLMTQSDLAVRYPGLVPLFRQLGNPTREQLIVAGMLTLVGVYAVKAAFLGYLGWRLMGFVHWIQADLSYRLFAGYLRQPYVFHMQRNSAQLIRNVVTETYLFAQTGIMNGLNLVAEALVLAGIFVLLLAIEPVGALVVVATVAIAGWSIIHLPRHRILRWGEARQLHEGLRLQHLQQGLGSAKDVKLLGREGEFLARYQSHNLDMAALGRRQNTLQLLPRLMLELLTVCGLAVLVVILIRQGKPIEGLLPSLGLFAAAAFRFMPSVNRVIYALQSVRYALPVIDILHRELRLLESVPPATRGMPFAVQNDIRLDCVSFRYPGAVVNALSDVSISITPRTTVGFIGGSGAGKSTLVDILLGLLEPASGAVKVDGVDIRANMRGWQQQIGYVPQSIYLTDDTLRRNVAFGVASEGIDEAAVRRAIRAAQLERFVGELPDGLESMVGERGIRLSGGQRQLIGIARALYHDPQVLVLDEATSSLDNATEQDFMQAVRALQHDKTIVIVAHRLTTVENCDRLLRLENGRVVEEGETAAILGQVISQGTWNS